MRKKSIEKRSGKSYSIKECCAVFCFYLAGYLPREIARVMDRSVEAIECIWRRICLNASDYPDKKLYELSPLYSKFAGAAKEYIEAQWSKIDEKNRPSVQELSRRMGITGKVIQEYIDKNNGWKKTPRPKLLNKGDKNENQS